MVQRGRSNTILLFSLLIYAFATLPWIQFAYILVFGLIAASAIRDHQSASLAMFGFVARLITNARNASRRETPLRGQILKICWAIDNYPTYMSSILYRKRQLFFMLDKSQRNAASTTYDRILKIDKLQEENSKFLTKIKEYAMEEFDIQEYEIKSVPSKPSSRGYEAVELLEHFVRDWSTGEPYEHNRAELLKPFESWLKNRKRVFVPGSGLGRFAADLLADPSNGVEVVDAPELSASMWLGSKYATSRSESSSSDTVYPFLLQYSYWKHGKDQLEPVSLSFPVDRPCPNYEYADFLKYDKGYKYDAVATLYFIDTAQNVFKYIDKIADVLAPNGIWCNYGPIKWGTAAHVEFSVDELLDYLKSSGWTILEMWENGTNKYNGSEKSMLISRYELIGWVAQRKA